MQTRADREARTDVTKFSQNGGKFKSWMADEIHCNSPFSWFQTWTLRCGRSFRSTICICRWLLDLEFESAITYCFVLMTRKRHRVSSMVDSLEEEGGRHYKFWNTFLKNVCSDPTSAIKINYTIRDHKFNSIQFNLFTPRSLRQYIFFMDRDNFDYVHWLFRW